MHSKAKKREEEIRNRKTFAKDLKFTPARNDLNLMFQQFKSVLLSTQTK